MLKREQTLIRAFDILFRLQEVFAPRFAVALRTIVNRVANGVTVIAGSLGAVAGISWKSIFVAMGAGNFSTLWFTDTRNLRNGALMSKCRILALAAKGKGYQHFC